MSPEERAKAALAFLAGGCGFDACANPDWLSCGCMAYIAQAIRDAEDAALERAARYVRCVALQTDDPEASKAFNLGLESAALSCRNLKSQEI